GLFVLIEFSVYFTFNAFDQRRKVEISPDSIDSLLKRIYEKDEMINRLSAEREIILQLSSEQDYQNILEKSLGVLLDLLKEEYGVASVVLLKGTGNNIHYLKGLGEPLPFQLDERMSYFVDSTRITEVADPSSLTLVVPLASDRQIIGYFLVMVRSERIKSFKADNFDKLKLQLVELSKALSLILKAEGLYIESIEDPLTGLATKRYFFKQLGDYIGLAKRHGAKLCLVMADIDNFKKINDTYGHLAGDIVLKTVAEIFKKNIMRRGDIAYNAYRYGGEELAIVLPRTGVQGAFKVAEKIRKAIENMEFVVTDKVKIAVTCSFGIAENDDECDAPEILIKRADTALYEAKNSGKNMVLVSRKNQTLRQQA
ncbi:MAG: GGDEF domain-containing protein, partial [Planctomycetes bacterium]|nr:GGDEF domain-containing protein [Planctomycetota bacterium]